MRETTILYKIKKNKLISLIFILFLGVNFSLLFSFEEGELNLSLWNRSHVYNLSLNNEQNLYETIFHIDISQSIINFGKFNLWVDNLYSANKYEVAKVYFNWENFKLGNTTLNTLLGDSFFQFSNLEDRFINTVYPYMYLRGGNLNLSTGHFRLNFFAGKLAQLGGLLASTYEITDQTLYGFKTKYKYGDRILLGTGYIYTENEKDYTREVLTKKNNILLFDSELNLFSWIKLMGEFRESFYKEKNSEKKNDFSYRIGPIIRTKKIEFELNYRYIGSNFRDISQKAQLEKDEKGLFSAIKFRLTNYINLFGSFDKFRDNVEENPERNTIKESHFFAGFSVYSPVLPYFSTRIEMSQKKSKKDFPDYIFRNTFGIFSQISKNFGSFSPYLRYRYEKNVDKLLSSNNNYSSTAYLGFRYTFRRTSSFWFEGILDQRFNYLKEETWRTISARAGLRYLFSPKFNIYTEIFYHREGIEKFLDRINAYLGINYELPWGFNLNFDIRSNIPLNNPNVSSTYWFTVRLNKKFKWGAPPKILGKVKGIAITGLGNIEGFIFNDLNQNMVKDPNEKGIPGLIVKLEDGSTCETDKNGKFKFSNVIEGIHKISMEERRIPANFYILSSVKKEIIIKARRTQKVNFALIEGSTISGRVINDINKNKKIDKDEKGIKDVLVLLKPIEKEKTKTKEKYLKEMILNTYTDSNGNFIFENILPGEYILSVDIETLPKRAWFITSPSKKIKILPGQKLENQNFFILIKPRPIIIYSDKNK